MNRHDRRKMEAMNRKKEGNVTPITQKPQEGQAPAQEAKPQTLSPEAEINRRIGNLQAYIKQQTAEIVDLEEKLQKAKDTKIAAEAMITMANNIREIYGNNAPAVEKKERKPRAKKHKALGSTVEPVVPPTE